MTVRPVRIPPSLLLLPLASLATLAPAAAWAQDRLVGLRAAGGGVTLEAVRFGGHGVFQDALGGADSLHVRGARQMTVPLTAAVPLGTSWTVDVASVYAIGVVTYESADPARPGERTATLSGPGDVRLRATGRLAGDALVVTLGANAPTGRARLGSEELTAVRVLAAPALGLGTPPVGAGGSGTLGVLSARSVGSWAVAGGASYELHGSYAPVAALVAGAPTTDFSPGDVVRLSIGADGLVGRQRVSLSVAADVFGTDRLRGGVPVSGAADDAAAPTIARVRLGPMLSADAQMQLAVPRVREAVLWASSRWRSRFARDGITVEGSSGTQLDGGVRTTLPLARATDLLLAADGRWQSGLAFDDALLTAAAAGGGLTAAVAHRVGGITVQPFARVHAGRVRTSPTASNAATGGAVGLTVLSRF